MVIEQECLSIILDIKAFEVYLIGKPFVLQTDHRAFNEYNNAETTMLDSCSGV